MNITDYAASVPEDLILGWVAWYVVRDEKVSHDALTQAAAAHNVTGVPGAPRPVDAFKRACRYSERNSIPYENEQRVNALIRKVTQTPDEVERHLVLEVVDPDGRTLSYDTAATLTYARDTDSITTKREVFGDDRDKLRDSVLANFNVEYTEARTTIDPQVIRLMVRHTLERCQAIAVRANGSVYFVPKSNWTELENLAGMLTEIGSNMTLLPLIDTSRQRDMVAQAFNDEIHQKATQTITELTDALQGDGVTAAMYARHIDKLNELKESTKDYSGIVEIEMTQANVEIEAVQRQLLRLMTEGKVREGR